MYRRLRAAWRAWRRRHFPTDPPWADLSKLDRWDGLDDRPVTRVR